MIDFSLHPKKQCFGRKNRNRALRISGICFALLFFWLFSYTTLSAQPATISNVSLYPNPFSPTGDGVRDEINISFYLNGSGTVHLQIGQGTPLSDLFSTTLDANPGLNVFVWDGADNNNLVLPDGKYGLKISFNDAEYLVERGIYIDTTPPDIDLISSAPNPFSPNGDGYQDVHTVQYRVKNSNVVYLGLIEVNFSAQTVSFVEDQNGNTGPHQIPYSDGMYLILNRPSSYYSQITAPSTVEYELTIGGTHSFPVNITRGQSLYKLGQNYNPYYWVSASIGMQLGELTYSGVDYLALYGIEGNATFNIFNNDGSIFSLNDLYSVYYGSFIDNPFDPSDIDTSIGRVYAINVGSTACAIPGGAIADGRYIYRIMITNAVEHATIESGELLVNSFPLELEASLSPARISPENQDGLFDQTIIHYNVSEDAFITVKILDLSNQVIRTLRQNYLLYGEQGSFVLWDGRDADGNFVAPGTEEMFIVEVTAHDRFIPEDVVSIHNTIIVDNEPPEGAVLYQPQPDSLSYSNVTITGTSNEMNSDIILFKNGVSQGVIGQTGNYPGYFDFNVTLDEGHNDIYVRLRDSVANMGFPSNTVNLFLDSQPPQIVVVAPPEGEVFGEREIAVRANVSDSGSGVSLVRFGFSLNNSPSLTWITGTQISGNLYGATYNVAPNISELDFAMFVEAKDVLENITVTTQPRVFYYREPESIEPPSFLASYPVADSNINQLSNSQVSVNLNVPGNLRTNPNHSYIILYHEPSGFGITHNLGAVLTYESDNETYTMNLTLNNPLGTDGEDDGEYRIYYRAEDVLGNFVTGEVFFNYDTLPPVISNYRINLSDQLSFQNGVYYFSDTVTSVQADVSDLLSGINFATNMTRILLYDNNDQLLLGVRQVDDHTIRWSLTNPQQPLPNIPQQYRIYMKVTDLAGNQLIHNEQFTLLYTHDPEIISHYPAADSNLNSLSNNRVTIRVADHNGFGLNSQLSSITLTGGGVTYSPGQNAGLVINTVSPNLYDVSLVLASPLANDGSADDLYSVTASIVDNIGEEITAAPYTFTYDSQSPVKDYALIANPESDTFDLIDQMTINEVIEYVEVGFSDPQLIHSGVNFASPQTKVLLFRGDGSLVQGSRQVIGEAVRWNLTTPLTEEGSFYVDYSAVDYAGNTGSGRINFFIADANAPVMIAAVPGANSIINVLPDNVVTVEIEDVIGIDTSNFTLNYLHLESPEGVLYSHNNGATLTITGLPDDRYLFSLELDYALPLDGSEDGIYKMIFRAENTDGYSFSNTIYFTYDTLPPVLQYAAIGTLGNLTNITNNEYYYGQVNTVRIQLADITSSLAWQSLVFTLSSENIDIPGQVTIYPNQRRAFLTLNETLSTVALYTISVTIDDLAGNTLHKEINFNLNTFDGSILAVSPPNGAFINSSLNSVSMTVDLLGDDTISETGTSIYVVHPHGDTISVNTGAVMTISQSGSEHTIHLQFAQPLSPDGTDEGLFTVHTDIETDQGAFIPYVHHFVFDSRPPYYTNLRINQTGVLYEFDDGNRMNDRTRQNYYFPDTVNSIQVDYRDQRDFSTTVVSEVDFAPNVSKIYLVDGSGNMVDGIRSWNQNETVIWTLNQPLSQPGVYTIMMQSGDQAENYLSTSLSFELIETVDPEITQKTPAASSYINNLANNRVTIRVADHNGFGLNSQLSSITLTGGGVTYSPGQNAGLVINTVSPNLYDVSLVLDAPLANDGSADDVYNVSAVIHDLIGGDTGADYSFVYDTQNPVFSNPVAGNNTGWEEELADGVIIDQGIDFVRISVTDLPAGVNFSAAGTFLRLQHISGVIIPGQLSNDGTNLLWTLFQTLPNDGTADGAYYISYGAVDYANNSLQGRIDFEFINPYTPTVTARSPEAGSMMSELIPPEISLEFVDEWGINLDDFTANYILLTTPDDVVIGHNNGAVLTINDLSDGLYSMILSLDNELSVEGTYLVSYRIENTEGYAISSDWEFTFDNVPPEISEIRAILADESEVSLVDGISFDQPVTGIRAKVVDTTSGVAFPADSTFISVLDDNGVPVPGTLTYDTQTKILKMTFTEELSVIDSSYELLIGAIDILDNYQEIGKSFHLFTIEAQIIEVYPAHESIINTTLNQVYVRVRLTFGEYVILDPNQTTIKLLNPDGEYIEHGYGAEKVITQTDDIIEVRLDLEEPLSEAGDADGYYNIEFTLITDAIEEGPLVTSFIYDRTLPYFDNVIVNSTPSRLRTAGGRDTHSLPEVDSRRSDLGIIAHSVHSVQADCYDLTAGVSFAPNMTTIILLDPDNNIIPGFRTLQNNTVKWTLHDPLDSSVENEGVYSISIKVTDRAGNQVTRVLPFEMVSVSPPESLTLFLDPLYKIHLHWSADALTNPHFYAYQIHRRFDNQDWEHLAYTTSNSYLDNLLNEPDGVYQYAVRIVYSDPNSCGYYYSEPALSPSAVLERFYDVTFNLTLSDGNIPSGIELHLISNDGVYNQEFLRLTDDDGVINISDVFNETYILTLTKQGYLTVVDTLLIDSQNREFAYELSDGNGLIAYGAEETKLFQNFPNPFNPATEIRFALQEQADVTLTVYNIKGQIVKTLLDRERMSQGYHRVDWNGVNQFNIPVSSGVYFYKLIADSPANRHVELRKMMLMK